MNTKFRVSLSFEVDIRMNDVAAIWWDDNYTELRDEIAREGKDVKFYIQHRLDKEEILSGGWNQKATVTNVEVIEHDMQ